MHSLNITLLKLGVLGEPCSCSLQEHMQILLHWHIWCMLTCPFSGRFDSVCLRKSNTSTFVSLEPIMRHLWPVIAACLAWMINLVSASSCIEFFNFFRSKLYYLVTLLFHNEICILPYEFFPVLCMLQSSTTTCMRLSLVDGKSRNFLYCCILNSGAIMAECCSISAPHRVLSRVLITAPYTQQYLIGYMQLL